MPKKAAESGKKAAIPEIHGGQLVPAIEIITPEVITHELRADAVLKEQQATVDVMVAELEKRLKLTQRECRKEKKKLVVQLSAAEKTAKTALDAFATTYGEWVVDEVKRTIAVLPELKSKKIESTVSAGALTKNGSVLYVEVSISGCKPHVNFSASLEAKIPADVKKAQAAVTKLQKTIQELDHKSLDLHRSLSNLDTAERQARAKYAREILKKTETGKNALKSIDEDLDATLLLLE